LLQDFRREAEKANRGEMVNVPFFLFYQDNMPIVFPKGK